MQCKNCGKEIANDSRFCSYCGFNNASSCVDNSSNNQIPQVVEQNLPVSQPTKKKKALLPAIILSVLVILTVIVTLAFPHIRDIYEDITGKSSSDDSRETSNRDKDKEDEAEREEEQADKDVEKTKNEIADKLKELLPRKSEEDPVNNDIVNEGTIIEDAVSEATVINQPAENVVFNPVYSYYDLTDVPSLDSDSRFSYSDSTEYQGISIYNFILNIDMQEEELMNALLAYGQELQNFYGFLKDEERTVLEDVSSGATTYYYIRGDDCLTITPILEDSYYVVVNIYSLSEQAAGYTEEEYNDYFYYNYFINNRETGDIIPETYMAIENQIMFNLINLDFTDIGNGTLEMVVTIDIGSNNGEVYAYDYDFMLAPQDINKKLIADACPVSYIRDTNGNDASFPLLLNSFETNRYYLYYYVPDTTETVAIYATNLYNDLSIAGPAYFVNYIW